MTQTLQIPVSRIFLRLSVMMTLTYIALQLYYCFFICREYGYMGFIPDFSILKFFLSQVFFLTLLSASHFLFSRSSFLYAVYLLLLFFFYMPNSILFAYSDMDYAPYLSNVFFVSCFLLSPLLKFKIPSFEIQEKYKDWSLIGITLLLMVPIALKFKSAFNLNTLLLRDVYDTRESFSDNMQGYLNYLYNFEAKTFIPLALVYFMIRRKTLWIVLLVLMLLYLYVISGNKIVYFTTFIIIFFYYMGESYLTKMSNLLIMLLAALIAIPLIDNLVLHDRILGGTFVNRFLFIPSLITQWYFKFFSGNPMYFAESHGFSAFVNSPYDMKVGFLLTKINWNEPEVFANNGIVSDGFMNLGYVGVGLLSLIFTALFSLFNSFKLHKGFFGLFFCYIYLFLSVPFLSCFITGGILIFIVLCFTIFKNGETTTDN
ncbi:MAG: hypothetical protein ACKOXB_12815 [Flavobacteriales bacterium]